MTKAREGGGIELPWVSTESYTYFFCGHYNDRGNFGQKLSDFSDGFLSFFWGGGLIITKKCKIPLRPRLNIYVLHDTTLIFIY